MRRKNHRANDAQLSLHLVEQTRARDAALDALESKRPRLIDIAKGIALQIASEKGTVSGPEVMRRMRETMRDDGELFSADPRFMGAVFRGSGWERVRWEPSGSHRQPISVWRKKT